LLEPSPNENDTGELIGRHPKNLSKADLEAAGLEKLEHFPISKNLRGFPNRSHCDSRCRLVKEASLHDETSFD